MATDPLASESDGGCSDVRPAYSRQLRVEDGTDGGTGELWSAAPAMAGRENASVPIRGRRQRSSQMPGCNGQDTVKDCQGKLNKMTVNRGSEESR